MTYGLDSRSYIKRAKKLLFWKTKRRLFYSALELRCGIEARLRQYNDVQDKISAKRKKGWRIVQLANNLEELFKSGNKIVEISIRKSNIKNSVQKLYYTPVSSELVNSAQRLGEYLHTPKKDIRFNKKWWLEFKLNIIKTLKELENANMGTLLGPPLSNKEGRLEMITEIGKGHMTRRKANQIAAIKEKVKIEVKAVN